MAHETEARPWWQLLGPDFPYSQLLTGGLIPILIFYAASRLNEALIGAVLAASWGALVLLVTYWRERTLNIFAALAVPGMLIELIGTLVTGSAEFYLAAAALTNALWGVVFLATLLLPQPLIQLIAQAFSPRLGSEEFMSEADLTPQRYRWSWQLLTAVWGGVNLLQALLLFIAQLWLPLEAFLVVKALLGAPVTILLILFSWRFLAWYWTRKPVNL